MLSRMMGLWSMLSHDADQKAGPHPFHGHSAEEEAKFNARVFGAD